MLFFRSPPAGLLIPSSRTVDNMQRENIVGKAGKMKGKDRVLVMMQSKGKAGFIRLQNSIRSGRIWKGTNNANRADGNIRQQSSPKAGWIMTSVGREDGLLYRKLRRSYWEMSLSAWWKGCEGFKGLHPIYFLLQTEYVFQETTLTTMQMASFPLLRPYIRQAFQ